MPRTILRLPEVLKRRGKSRSSHYADIKAGLFVKPVKLGLRAQGTPDDEVDALNAATIAGRSGDEIRALVVKLQAARKVVAFGRDDGLASDTFAARSSEGPTAPALRDAAKARRGF